MKRLWFYVFLLSMKYVMSDINRTAQTQLSSLQTWKKGQ